AIAINDYIGIPDAGPRGTTLYVAGSGFVPNYTGISVKFNNLTVNPEDTSYYSDDFVYGGLITSNATGNFNVRFTIPETTADGTYEVKAYAGASSSTQPLTYTVRNTTTAEIAIYDLVGDISSGPSGSELICRGVYFTPMINNIKLMMGTTELQLVDTPTYSADFLFPPDNKLIRSDYDGKFEMKFNIPADAPDGVYNVQAYVDNAPMSNIASYTVTNYTPTLTFTDTSTPYNAGPSSEVVKVSGSGFAANSADIKLYFNGAVQNLTLPADYSGSATIIDNQKITADSNGSFEVEFVTPLLTPGVYNIIAFNSLKSTATYTYSLGPVSTFITSSHSDCSTNDDAFNRNAVMYLKVLNSELNRYNITDAYFTVQCNFHTASPHVSAHIPLTNNGDMSYTANFNWSAYSNVHNGNWQVNFYIKDGNGVLYNPTKVINITGTNVSTQSYIVSAMGNLSSSTYAFNDTSTNMYYKIQSHIVDSMNITEESAKIYCARKSDTGTGHLVNLSTLTNNADGTYNGSQDFASLSPACHLGLWYLEMKIYDSFYASYNPIQEFCVFSTTSEVRAILSRNKYFSEGVDYNTAGTSSSTTYTYNLNGKVYIMINTRPANINEGNITSAYFNTQFAKSAYNLGRTGGTPARTVTSPNYNLTNLGNGCFSGEVMLNATGNNRRSTDLYFRVKYTIIDSANTQVVGYTGKQAIDTSSAQSNFGITMNDGECPDCHESKIPFMKEIFRSVSAMADASASSWHNALDSVRLKTFNAFERARWTAAMASPKPRKSMADRAAEIELTAFMSRNANQAKNRFGDEAMARDVKMLADPAGRDIYNRFRMADITKNYKRDCLPAEQGRSDYNKKLISEKQNTMANNVNVKSSYINNVINSALMPDAANAATYTGKYAVVRKIRDWVVAGGYMFTMCYATETLDRTLQKDASGNRLVNADSTYDYGFCFAFTGFNPDAMNGATGAINGNNTSNFTVVNQDNTADKYKRPLAVIQNHKFTLPGYSGATDSFAAAYVKSVTGPKNSPVNILARISATQIKYLAAEYGEGWFSFLAGHDPKLVETYRLILDNIMIGSLSPNNPQTGSYMSYGIIDWNMTDGGYDGDKSEYTKTMTYGRSPSLFGTISATYPGDIAGDQLVDSLPYCYEDATVAGVTGIYSADLQTPISSGAAKRSYLEYADGSSRFVLVPIVSTFKTNGSLACTQATNVANTPAFIYKIIGRDKVRIKAYALFYLSDNVAHADADPVYNEVGATTYGEVRGKFVGYLK
ncbi:MAG TPA: hypothetical protein PKK26_05010, partial [Candidatus Wallbacteria bacterium]|nr:hypothetical protein [Candidatus Wallbacteria bacterium]